MAIWDFQSDRGVIQVSFRELVDGPQRSDGEEMVCNQAASAERASRPATRVDDRRVLQGVICVLRLGAFWADADGALQAGHNVSTAGAKPALWAEVARSK